ncbi:uncharacterized protein LOC123558461 [Mercenaria mercenaria]|uniref:uncharacterized protein LOC123558461 n=1 Tax=Mercenaria mercenaria TaxID=6596 RepID=UPI00234E6D32|nr:uncharacterized protein LOC123558461 [Mercenaria mercenaria]
MSGGNRVMQKSALSEKNLYSKFSKLIGKLVATEPGVQYAPLYYKPLEKVKEIQLGKHKGNYDSFFTIPHSLHSSLEWWISNLPLCYKKVSQGPPKLVLYSDASKLGWGAYNKNDNVRTGGEWSIVEQSLHINILELKAFQFTILTFCKDISDKHVRVFTDNTTTCSYVNCLGGKKHELNALARDIWFWCIARNIHISAAHVPGEQNSEADEQSRTVNDDLEWALKSKIFQSVEIRFPGISIDLFASRLNHKTPQYVSRKPDPNALAIDAFALTWTDHLYYIFPPFSLIPRILQKIEEDEAEAVLVAPIWPTQCWWPNLLRIIMDQPIRLPNPQRILFLPHKPDRIHPLKKLKLGVFHVSGRSFAEEVSQKWRANSYSNPGGTVPKGSMTHISKNGLNFVDLT